MSAEEKKQINIRLAEVAHAFGLKIQLTVSNAHRIIEDNYNKIRSIDQRIQHRLTDMKLVV